MSLHPSKIKFDSEIEIDPGMHIVLTVRPPYPFRGDCLVVKRISRGFVIDRIVVGLSFQTFEPIPAEVFTDKAQIRTSLKVCRPTDDFTLTVTNISKEPARFKATMYGTEYREESARTGTGCSDGSKE